MGRVFDRTGEGLFPAATCPLCHGTGWRVTNNGPLCLRCERLKRDDEKTPGPISSRRCGFSAATI